MTTFHHDVGRRAFGVFHLRCQPFAHPTEGGLDIGNCDFTVEFRLNANPSSGDESVVMEMAASVAE